MIRDILYEDIFKSKASENMTLSNINKYIFENKYIYSMLDRNLLKDGNMYYMCLCIGIGMKKHCSLFCRVHERQYVLHYSSNGSDYVSVPQYLPDCHKRNGKIL